MKRNTIPTPLYKKVFNYFFAGIKISLFLAFILTVLFSIGISYSIVSSKGSLRLQGSFLLVVELIITSFIISFIFALSLNILSIIIKLIKRDFPDPLEPIDPDKVLEELIPLLKQTERENISMKFSIPTERKVISLTTSKVGGRPYMPITTKWPENNNGQKLQFFGQVNFEEVPLNNELPIKGLLQIFLLDDGWMKGLDHTNLENNVGTSNMKILFYPEVNVDTQQKDIAIKIPSKEFPIQNEAHITFEKPISQFRPLDNYLTPKKEIVNIAIRELEYIDSLLEEAGIHTYNDDSFLLGYPLFQQDDPRTFHKIANKISKDDEWVQLFQFCHTTDEISKKTIVQWGDAGYGYIFIKKNHLKENRFDNIFYWWDCM